MNTRSMTAPSIIAALALTLACVAQTTPAPATAPATPSIPAPPTKVAIDLSSPAKSVQTVLTAMHNGDFTTARDVMLIPSAHADDVKVLLDTMDAIAKMQTAAHAKFLEAGDKAFGTPTTAMLTDKLKQLAAATITENGDSATVTLAANPELKMNGGDILLKKLGPNWEIDGASFFKLDDPATAERIALSKKITAIAQAMTTEIAAGKFFSASDAYVEFWTRCQAAGK